MTFWERSASVITSLLSPTNSRVDASTPARLARYEYQWSWETGSVFVGNQGAGGPPISQYSEVLKQTLHLYRNTRLVWNPFPTLTDFWGSVIYPGVLTRDGLALPDGSPSAIPFPEDTDPALIAAAVQIWAWSNMQAQKYVIPHWAAIAGNVLIKIIDDVVAEKIVLLPMWPGVVKDIALNAAGDVTSVFLEWPVQPPSGDRYLYGEEMRKDVFRTYRDGKLYDYSSGVLGAEWPNDFGFVPACWVPHRPSGGTYADPAIGSALPELLEINSLESQINDGVGRGLKPIPWFATDGNIAPLFNKPKRGATDDFDPEDVDRESFTAFKLPPGAQVGKIDPSGSIADADTRLDKAKQAWLRKFPEVSMWESLRERDISGVAAEILHGDTRNKVLSVRPSTDRQVEKATQMGITMAAIRRKGTWRKQTKTRAVFEPFDARSFESEQLNFEIDDRPLIPEAPLTEREKTDLADIRLNKLLLPKSWVFEQMGVPTDVVDELDQADVVAPAVARQGDLRAVDQAQNQALALIAGQTNGQNNGGTNG